ncbi:MAG: aminotransferase class I/II-fold pyridoxal phosphate-dependent enzyme [Candidatus Eisenbacteria bacterium]|nr:aminotransferase class I/II-fold pyridoxal phosphate-dependent enzyme [Candidatus Eisenbacteria bacterium]
MRNAIQFRRAERLNQLPPYLFVEIDRAKNELLSRGVDLVDLGIGDPDLPTFPEIVNALKKAAEDPSTHRYPCQRGDPKLREEIALWFGKNYGVELDPEREVLVLIGTKEALGHLPIAVLDPGRSALVPDPAYPVYQAASWLAGGEVAHVKLEPELGFRPDLDRLSRRALDDAQLMFLNYPNNPTGATADPELFQIALNLAREHGFAVVNDAAYSEIVFDGPRVSLLQSGGAMENAIELHSFSKTYNMTGWRVGFAVGNAEILDALGKVKDNVDSCVFTAIQRAALAALKLPRERVRLQLDTYRRRRDVLVDGLWKAGWKVPRPRATFYVWARVPDGGGDSTAFAKRVLDEAHVVITPGAGFGPSGEGYVRMALTATEERVAEAVDRISRIL